MWSACLLLHFAVYMSVYSTEVSVKGLFFKALTHASIEGERYRTMEQAVSRIDCVIKCPMDSHCSVVTYDSATKDCAFYSWLNITLILNAITSITPWVNIETLWLSARHNDSATMDFAGAQQLCTKLGGHVTSSAFLFDNWRDSGYNLCRCGFVDDGELRFVLTTVDINCPESYNSTGVLYCMSKPASYAYCSFD